METGSNNLTVEGSSSTTTSDSLNGLKFGQKIYFEDGGGVCGKSTALPTTSIGGGGVKKGGKSVVQSGQPPRCQVEGCKVDLSDAKAYYSRHKVCVLHSKSSLVIVNGLEQRFCQQCSRFHRLPEFDQGKRSCRRRLAGHNERRRKPPPGSLLSSRFGRLSSSLLCGNTSKGGVLLDFSSHARHFEKDLWPVSETSEQVSGSRSRSIMWQGNSMDPLSKMYLQNPTSGSNFSYPSGECNTGVSSDSTCALSLLSNQTWSSGNRSSGTVLGNLLNIDGVPVSHSNTGHGVTVAQFPTNNSSSSLWGFKSNNNGGAVDCGLLGQFSQPHFNGHFHGDIVMDPVQDGGRHYMDVDHSRVFDLTTSNQVDWSL